MLEGGTRNGLAVERKYGGVNNWLIVPLKNFFPVYICMLWWEKKLMSLDIMF